MSPTVSDSTLSPTPFSPFSSYSVASGVTSDDAPDLGAFTTVFRALNHFQPQSHVAPAQFEEVSSATTDSSMIMSHSDYESEVTAESTVWTRHPVSSYLSYSSPDSPSHDRSPPPSESDSTASDVERTDLPTTTDGADENLDPPSLGDLDAALGFLAAERAKFVAQRDVGLRGNSSSATTTSEGAWHHVITPRRKRRRKKNRSMQDLSRVRILQRGQDILTDSTAVDATTADDGDADDGYDSSSSIDAPSSSPQVKPLHISLSRPRNERRRQHPPSKPSTPYLHHSKSTPNLIPPVSIPLDARVLHLRNLAHKLRLFFPQDANALHDILAPDSTSTAPSGFVDTRGPVPRSQDTLIHVFIDHSNILIGFLTYLKRHLHHMPRTKSKYLSHAALALILERGRPITRRVLVASSPLYQPVNTAEQLGYEVRVYARVPDTGDGADRLRRGHNRSESHSSHSPHRGRTRRGASHARAHSHRNSYGGGGTSTESDTGSGSGGAARVRYREQGVDELLQLKLHQAIADVDEVPPGATIVLATGDGNVGQFNEEGFLGVVRTALKKGWRVELYAWEGGMSRAWLREFGEGPYSSRFQVHMLDRFAPDLLEV
ncbi:hypothetical protein WOLCODRAFT_157743 [Wolfiporia cocos MD-104 SS10]|uniref:NYN domain-containing protein n=1 Tax=Wolfiporia cocos (strain MD-104) TaxID=742152 RepID=A0A2H3J514_WOLCO|nr:hypothetical protein WOLCODRAFT_157743 [Wolfiporia cocos MD-104 SS10]